MAMPRKRLGARVLGPYEDTPGRWRVVSVATDGARRSRNFTDGREAKEYAAFLRAELDATAISSFEDAIKGYRQVMIDKGNRPKSYEETTRRLHLFFDGVATLQSLTPKKCAALYEKLVTATVRTKGPVIVEVPVYQTDSHRNMLAEARTFLGWCVGRGWMAANPLAGVQGKGRRKKGKEQFRWDEARKFEALAFDLADGGDEGPLAALVAFYFGIRAGEVIRLEVRDLDDDARLLWVDGTKTKAARRVLKVPERLRPLLVAHVEGKAATALLFPHRREWVNAWTRRLCSDAGVTVICAHALRGTGSSLSARSGGMPELIEASLSLGHESTRTTTEHYVTKEARTEAEQATMLKVVKGGKA